MTFSKVILAGVLSSDAEKRFTPQNVGVTVLHLSVANPRPPRGGAETYFTVKVNCARGLADATEGLQKNHVVQVEGRLQILKYTSPEGQPRQMYEIDASAIYVLPGLPQALSPLPQGGMSGGYQSAAAPQNPNLPPMDYTPAPPPQATQPAMAPAGGFQVADLSATDFITEDDIPF